MGRGRVFLMFVGCSGSLILLVIYQLGDKSGSKGKFMPGLDAQLTDKSWIQDWDHEIPNSKRETQTKSFPKSLKDQVPSPTETTSSPTTTRTFGTPTVTTVPKEHKATTVKSAELEHKQVPAGPIVIKNDVRKKQWQQSSQPLNQDTQVKVTVRKTSKGILDNSKNSLTKTKSDTQGANKTNAKQNSTKTNHVIRQNPTAPNKTETERKVMRSENTKQLQQSRNDVADLGDPKPTPNVEKEALDEWQHALEQQQYNLQHWKLEEERKLAEEREKLEAERKRILQEKRQLKKDLNEAVNGMLENQYPQSGFQKLQIPENLAPANPKYWEGLNSTEVHTKFSGMAFLPDFNFHEFVDPSDPSASGMQGHPKSLDDLTDGQAEERFYQLVAQRHMECAEVQRMGSIGDGGWDVCISEPYKPKPGCIVYSFGINYDFTFDDAMANTFECEVRTFDPSMSIGDHMHSEKVYFYQIGLGSSNSVNEDGWKLATLKSILKKLKHTEVVIDILKVDIEFNEWDSFAPMLTDGSLKNVKQLAFEMHTPEVFTVRRPGNKGDFAMMYNVLKGLEEIGFRRYRFHFNPMGRYISIRTGKQRSCCYELYYLNLSFLKEAMKKS